MSIIHWPLDKWLDNVALAALSSKETLLATFDLARNVIERGVPGDFVECGVFGGAQCAVMARAIWNEAHFVGGGCLGDNEFECAQYSHEQQRPYSRKVHLFDSFTGVPAPGKYDTEWLDAGHAAGTSICTLDAVKAHMAEWGIPDELLVYHEGLFEDTIPEADLLIPGTTAVQAIALLRLDGDLYESTRVCVQHLEPLVSPGGWIIVDDFGLSGARKAFLETVRSDTGPAYFKKSAL